METERLILRRFVIEDAGQMYRNWASDSAVTAFLTWPPHADISVTQSVLKAWIERYDRPDFYAWGMELKTTSELIGNISAVKVDNAKAAADLGWCMGTKWWGQNLMPEAAAAVIGYLFLEVGFNRIAANHDPNNAKSGRVMQKVGMQYEGTLRASGLSNQGIVDEVCYSILRNEYHGTPAGFATTS